MHGYVVRMPFNHDLQVVVFIDDGRQLTEDVLGLIAQSKAAGAEEHLVGNGYMDHSSADFDLEVVVGDVRQGPPEVHNQDQIQRIFLLNLVGQIFDE